MDSSLLKRLPAVTRRRKRSTRLAVGVGIFLVAWVVVACVIVPHLWNTHSPHRTRLGDDARLIETRDGNGARSRNVTASVLQADLRLLQSSSSQLDKTVAEIQTLAQSTPWRAKGFFDARQEDQIEGLLFRYLTSRHALWHLTNYHKDHDTGYADADTRVKSCLITFCAGYQLILADASLVSAFRGDTVAIDMLNEEFYRSRIPPGTYDRLLFEVTDETHLRSLRDSFLAYTTGLDDADSTVARTVKRNPVYGDLVRRTRSAAQKTDTIAQELVGTKSRLFAEIDNRLRHTRVAELLSKSESKTGELLFAARAHLFKGVSRIKNPEAHLVRFSVDQKRRVYDALEPGDIILTFTAGYISDVFIPGTFKHAITYVGSPQDRRDAGLFAKRLATLPVAERAILLRSVDVATLPSGQNADVIEAVGEGVIFNHLGNIMDTHINRLLVLRPKVSPQERTLALANVFLFLGDEYDFQFDFADASKQVCTEVVYRALDGKGSIRFTLVKRAGHETLSADDIANSYLAAPGKSFAFVLLAEEAPDSKEHRAQVLTGVAGSQRLRELMADP